MSTALLVAAVGGGAIVRGLIEQSEYEGRSYERNSEYTADTYSPAYEACLSPTTKSQPDCIAKANNEYRENERKEQDLIAQQTTAIWTFLMGCAAIIGMMLSALGVYLVFTTFKETQRTARTAQETLDAYRQAERARLTVTVSPPSVSGDELVFWLNISNIGRSATIVSMIEWHVFTERRFPLRLRKHHLIRQMPLDDFFDKIDNNLRTIAPEKPVRFRMAVEWGENFIRSRFIIGRICYDAIDRRSHVFYFCYGFSPQIGKDPRTGPFKINDLNAKSDHPEET